MLVIAIFILTVMALLGLAMTKVLNSANNSMAVEVLGTRAFFAAQSGADIGLATLFPVEKNTTNCAAIERLNAKEWLPNDTGFKSCSVTLSCKAENVSYQGKNITQYFITSSASCGEKNLRVNRQVQVEARSNG